MNEMYEKQELRHLLEFPVRNYKDRIFRMLFKEKHRALELYNALNNTAYTNADDLVITTLENAIYLGMKNDISFVLYDRLMLSLSDAYERPTEDPALELKVFVLNINPGYNEELKARSKTLCEYMLFVDAVRNYSKSMPFPEAIETAIDECIRGGILADFLRRNKAEVQKVGIFEYDEEKHLEMERNEAEERGEERGEERLNLLLSKLLNDEKLEEIKKITTDKELRKKLYKEYGIL